MMPEYLKKLIDKHKEYPSYIVMQIIERNENNNDLDLYLSSRLEHGEIDGVKLSQVFVESLSASGAVSYYDHLDNLIDTFINKGCDLNDCSMILSCRCINENEKILRCLADKGMDLNANILAPVYAYDFDVGIYFTGEYKPEQFYEKYKDTYSEEDYNCSRYFVYFAFDNPEIINLNLSNTHPRYKHDPWLLDLCKKEGNYKMIGDIFADLINSSQDKPYFYDESNYNPHISLIPLDSLMDLESEISSKNITGNLAHAISTRASRNPIFKEKRKLMEVVEQHQVKETIDTPTKRRRI